MRISNVGLQLIKSFEGLILYSYDDRDGNHPPKRIRPGDPVKGVLTIGYGNIEHPVPGLTCTEQQAEDWLKEDLADAENEVVKRVHVTVNQNQFDALVSFEFNTGGLWLTDRKGRGVASRLLLQLNAGHYGGAADQFDRWVHDGGKIVQGLVRRRAAEKKLFEKQVE